MFKKILKTMSTLTVVATVAMPMSSMAKNKSDTIKMVDNNWASQQVLTRVIGTLFKKNGWKIEYVPSDTQLQFPAMGNGDAHLQVEIWEATMEKPFSKEVKAGRMEELVRYNAVTLEDWWYPSYVEEICPGLPDWKALNKCAGKFSTIETEPKGRYLAGPVDWAKKDQERVDALDLNFEVVNAGAYSALVAELEAAYKRKEPIIVFNWTPNWVEAKFDGKFVKWPEYNPKCFTDASWGINPNATHDCGNNPKGYLKMGAWSGLKKKWPEAYKVLKKVNLNNGQIADMATLADVDKLSPQEAAEKWIKNNKSVWSKWFKM